MKSKYLSYAQQIAQVLTENWFGEQAPEDWVSNGDYWHTPAVLTSLIDLMRLTGSKDYLTTLANGLTAFYYYFDINTPPSDRTLPAYYDDETVWAQCFMDAYDLTQDHNYRDAVEQIYADLQYGWTSDCNGGIWWMRKAADYENADIKATNSTLGFLEMALWLYQLTQQTSYLNDAQNAWKWISDSKLIDAKGLVWGGLTNPGCTVDPNNKPVVALQGNPLMSLWKLAQITKDESYLDLGELICTATLSNFTWSGDNILRTECEADNTCSPSDTNSAQFKSVFIRYMGDFIQQLLTVPARQQSAQKFAAFITHNADTVWANFPKRIVGIDWHTADPHYQPSGQDVYDGANQDSALALFIAAALVSS